MHGEVTASKASLVLEDTEWIVKVKMRADSTICQLILETDEANSFGPYGAEEGDITYLPIAEGWMLGSISGVGLKVVNLIANTERIVLVKIRSDSVIRQLTFETNDDNVHGPYGPETGDMFYPPMAES